MTFLIEVLVWPDLWLTHLIWATILAFILTKGPGPISLAALIFRRLLSAPRTACANSVR
jgi:putative oxidoreductase